MCIYIYLYTYKLSLYNHLILEKCQKKVLFFFPNANFDLKNHSLKKVMEHFLCARNSLGAGDIAINKKTKIFAFICICVLTNM